MRNYLNALLICIAISTSFTSSLALAEQKADFDSPKGDKQAVDSEKREFEETEINGLKVSIWKPAPPNARPLPLVIFSHGFHGSSNQSTALMKAISDSGYYVIAPNHKDASRGKGDGDFKLRPDVGFRDSESWDSNTHKDRAEDIKSLIQALKTDTNWSKSVDWSKVALAGHSLGGYTVLGLAGAWPDWKIEGIKAVLVLSPYLRPYVRRETLKLIKVPVMYQGGTRDYSVTSYIEKENGAFDQTPSPAYFVDIEKAGHLAWTDIRSEFQKPIEYYSIAFLNRYLKDDRSLDLKQKLAQVSEVRFK